MQIISSVELAALKRFSDTCEDGQGYDVPALMMNRLAEIGVVQRLRKNFYSVTIVGHRVLEINNPYDHITDGSPCWCNPETTYTDPDTGVSVIVHKEPQ